MGTPKGVVLTHGNMAFTLGAFLYNLDPLPDDMYFAYLPLAHVLELLGESMCVAWGCTIGYSHPNTLTDKSTMSKKGAFVEALMDFCVDYKLECSKRGEQTPIMDRLIFKSIRMLVGGRVRAILSGGAPLSPHTHDY